MKTLLERQLTHLISIILFVACLTVTGYLTANYNFGFSSLLLLPLAYIGWRYGRWVGFILGFLSPFLLFNFVQFFEGDLSDFVNHGFGPGSLGLGLMGFLVGFIAEQSSRSQRAEARAKLARDALELVASDQPLDETLDQLIRRVEQEVPEGKCSILLLDREAGKLRHAAAPQLPPEYCEAIDGVEIGPSVGSCGTAAYLNESVIVTNIQTDPLWKDFADLAAKSGLRACWSIPIRDAQQDVLGTYAVYYDHQRSPTDHELGIVSEAANLSGLAIVRDSDRKKQLELERQVQTAQKLEGLGMLAGGIAHDFNNILVSIIGNAELLSLDLDTPEHNDRLDGIVSAAHRAADLSRQILIYAGGSQGQITDVNLSSMVEELQSLITVANSNQVNLKLELAPDLPSVTADESQLHQVLINLVTNAIESTAEGRGEVSVKTSVRDISQDTLNSALLGSDLKPGAYVCLEVEDNGAGMSDDVKHDIFNPFYSTKANGRGLGLAIIFGVLRRCNGALLLESSPGEGASFQILLSANPDRSVAESAALPTWRGEGAALVVDDESAVRNIAADYLKAMGYSPVLVAAGGAEGLKYIDSDRDDLNLILVDLSMPEVDGKQVIKRASEKMLKATTVLMTGNDSNEEAFAIQHQVLVLLKPFTFESLSAILSRSSNR